MREGLIGAAMITTVYHKFLASLLFGALSVFGINMGTEQPGYEVLQQINPHVEIRRYPARIAAETAVDAGAANPRGEAFRIIAGYIFGANRGKKTIEMTSPVEITAPGAKIAMTAPVEVGSSKDRLVMRFYAAGIHR